MVQLALMCAVSTQNWSLKDIYLLHVSLNVSQHIVHIKIMSKIWHKAMSIANIDQRPCVWQFGFHQEVLSPLGRIEVRFSSDALHFFNLARLCCSLDVLVMDLRVLTGHTTFNTSGKVGLYKMRNRHAQVRSYDCKYFQHHPPMKAACLQKTLQ